MPSFVINPITQIQNAQERAQNNPVNTGKHYVMAAGKKYEVKDGNVITEHGIFSLEEFKSMFKLADNAVFYISIGIGVLLLIWLMKK